MWLVQPGEEADLVRRCRAGEPEALRKLFERERLHVHRLLYRVVGSNTHMDDLIQDTFLEVFRSLPSFRGESSLRTWIHRCAVRVAYAHFRRKARLPALEPVQDMDSEAPSPEERTSRREAVRRLYAELDKLEPKQRMAFTLFALEGHSLREIAEIMESTLTTAKVRAWRARRTLEGRARKDPLLAEFLAGGSPREEEAPR
jgi:RNA polymerase sigma-70 factor (ECF subfamily)